MNTLAALLVLILTANPSADLERMALSGEAEPDRVAQTLEAGLAELDGQSRPQLCMDAFLAGELYRKAAAVVPDGGYQQQALEAFRAMRVDYMDLPAGALGYIGESRVHLQAGDAEQALAALAPLLDSPGVTKIKRLAEIESLEALLLIEPGRAVSQARQLGEPAHWFLARALARQGDHEEALELARSETVVATAPSYHRLKLIADLDALNDVERSAWAEALVRVGLQEEALAVLREHAPVDSASLYAGLLQDAGDMQAAAEQWRVAIQNGAGPTAQLARAACLASIAEDDPSQKPAALKAYHALIESDADDGTRREALRRWIHLNGSEQYGEMLAAHQDLVGLDPYLRYARVVYLRDTDDPESLIPELKNIASDTEDPALRASAVLMQAQIDPDPRAALAVLDTSWDDLLAQPTLADAARARRVGLWVELGMIDRAVDQVLGDSSARPTELLMVAEALADRYADGIAGNNQARVLLLTNAALDAAPNDESTALAAARLLLRVDAKSDAVRLLSSLSLAEAKPVLADALRHLGKPQDALDVLEGLQTPEAALHRGHCLLALNQPEGALIEIRQARNASAAGSDFWWDATLALAAVQIQMGDRLAAEEVLRVAEALYPVNARPELHAKLQTIKKEYP